MTRIQEDGELGMRNSVNVAVGKPDLSGSKADVQQFVDRFGIHRPGLSERATDARQPNYTIAIRARRCSRPIPGYARHCPPPCGHAGSIPPRAVKAATSVIRRGPTTLTTSSRMRLVASS